MAVDVWRTRPYLYNSGLGQAVDRLFDQALQGMDTGDGGGQNAGFRTLPVNVWESPEGYQAAILAPALNEHTISVTVHEDTLVLEGDLQFQTPENARMIWQEFGPSKFRRSLRLGAAVDPAKVEAMYRNGLLLVTMPKAENAKPRQIQVQVTGTPSAPRVEGKTPAPRK